MRLLSTRQRDRQRAYHRMRRAIVGRGEYIDRFALANAHGWVCGICGRHIHTSGANLTIDHRVPLARGGTHTWANVQPAHKRCNERATRLKARGTFTSAATYCAVLATRQQWKKRAHHQTAVRDLPTALRGKRGAA